MCSGEDRKGIPAGRDSMNKTRELDRGQCRKEVLWAVRILWGEAGEGGRCCGRVLKVAKPL